MTASFSRWIALRFASARVRILELFYMLLYYTILKETKRLQGRKRRRDGANMAFLTSMGEPLAALQEEREGTRGQRK